jgi:hypothetical protein
MISVLRSLEVLNASPHQGNVPAIHLENALREGEGGSAMPTVAPL